MDDHDGLALVEEVIERLEPLVARIDAVRVARDLNAEGAQIVERAARFLDRLIDAGGREYGAEPEAVGLRRTEVGKLLVDAAGPIAGALVRAQMDVGRGDREHGIVHADLVHEGERLVGRPRRLREPVNRCGIDARLIEESQIAGRQHV